jgi:hypothetical protein
MRGSSPASTIRGGPGLASESSENAATTFPACVFAKWRAPALPKAPPSVATNTSVCCGVTARAPAAEPYERASWISAAMPEPLLFAPGPVPSSSRCARTAISSGERPGTVTTWLTSARLPIPGSSALKRSGETWRPYGASWSRTHCAAPAAPAVPGTRSG